MDSRSIFRPRLQCVINPRGTLERSASGFVDWPFKDVGKPRSEYKKEGLLSFASRGVDRQEKPWWGMLQSSVP